jgi:hypothetical protein
VEKGTYWPWGREGGQGRAKRMGGREMKKSENMTKKRIEQCNKKKTKPMVDHTHTKRSLGMGMWKEIREGKEGNWTACTEGGARRKGLC